MEFFTNYFSPDRKQQKIREDSQYPLALRQAAEIVNPKMDPFTYYFENLAEKLKIGFDNTQYLLAEKRTSNRWRVSTNALVGGMAGLSIPLAASGLALGFDFLTSVVSGYEATLAGNINREYRNLFNHGLSFPILFGAIIGANWEKP